MSPDNRFPAEIIEELLERLRKGESLRAICADRRMPDRETIRRWSEGDGALAAAILSARELGYLDRAEAAVEAAKSAENAAAGRLAFDAEKWFLGKLSRAFADRGDKATGAGDAAAVPHAHRIDLSDAPMDVLRYLAEQSLGDDDQR